MKHCLHLGALFLCCFGLQGCLVASAVDLAATTVFTAGKVVVKGTGAMIDAAMPDKDEDENKKNRKKEKAQIEASDYEPSE
ncbi:NF038104 family lipoprotein [Neisseria wadsworthii]|uniref:NF038104 family lipoprotein n=1 Tax=Neisseria wadsworthii TaxID=607711 RepID=UPI000D30A165|nr:NF038104 family lipoprotein [Neisseria wadsworthii]